MKRRQLIIPAHIPLTKHIWQNMMFRCYNSNAVNYRDYGGRNILVCERWHIFDNFLHDMGTLPEGKSIDRHPNNNGNYEPGNCRWATPKQQQNNLRSNVLLTHNGKTQTMAQWADELSITRHALWARLNKYNMPLELALSAVGDARTPMYSRKSRHIVTYKNELMTLREACVAKGVKYQAVITRRHRDSLTPQEAFDCY